MSDFITAIENRRSIYAIGKEKVVSEEKITQIIEKLVLNVPSPYNMQSSRTVILFDDESSKLWKIVLNAIAKFVPPEKLSSTESKIKTFDGGYGTILYFEDTTTVKNMMQKFPLYADKFKTWSYQSNGMLEFAIWTALEAEGLGVNIQHYNPIIDDEVKKTWNLPQEWELIAEMPFGSVVHGAGEKTFMPIEQRLFKFPLL